jgi:hypothetical protein
VGLLNKKNMYPNINSGFGSMMKNALAGNPSTGRIFVVCKASLTTIKPEIDAMYGAGYPDGVAAVYTTIAGALASCVANRGDIVFVAPGHTETVTGADGIAFTTTAAGVTIIGLGNGTIRPTITYTTAVGASVDIDQANVTVKNIIFTCGIDNQTAMVNVTGAYVTFDGCEFNTNSGTAGAAIGILTAATATGLKVVNCRFLGPATNSGTTTTAQIDHEVGVDYVIENNYFTGKCTQNITNGTAVLRGLIRNNTFVTATGTKSINMHASSTPMIVNNRMNVPSGTAPVVAAAGFVAGNVYSAAAGVTAGTASTF